MIKKLLCAALSSVFALTAVVGGLGEAFVNDMSVAFAEESSENSDTLLAGVYVVPLIPATSVTDKTPLGNSALHFGANAILTVDDFGSQKLTIGVSHWSFYEAFIFRKQQYADEDNINYPTYLFNSDNIDKFTKLSSYLTNFVTYFSSDVDSWFEYGENKYGNFTAEINEDIDYAYVTFDVEDYTKNINIATWLNTSSLKSATYLASYMNLVTLYLDTDRMVNVSTMKDADDVSSWTYGVSIPTKRYDTTSKTFTLRCAVSYTGETSLNNVFDGATIEKDADKYSVKLHVSDSELYTDFKLLDKISYGDSKTYQDWDVLYNGEFTPLAVNDSCISIEYDSLNEALLGKYLYFDDDVTDNKICFCVIGLTTKEVKPLVISNAQTGIYIKTDSSVYDENTTLEVVKNGDVYYTNASGDVEDVTDYWNSALFTEPNWYSLYLKDSEGNTLNSNKNVDVYIPLPENYNENEWFLDIRVNGKQIETSTRLDSSRIEDGYLIRPNKPVTGLTVAIMKEAGRDDISGLADGIYSAKAYFVKAGASNNVSMSDAALNRDVYIVIENGIKKIYFTLGTTAGTYVGDLYCDDSTPNNGIVHEDSISYTDFLTDENGELVDNLNYNAYTECGCVKGGILTLYDEAFVEEENAYTIALIPPAMTSGQEYSKIKKDATAAWLIFTDVEKSDNSLEIVEAEYGYKKSALTRQVKIAEIKLEEVESASLYGIEYSPYAVSNLETLLEKYRNSTNYKEAVTALEAANKKIAVMEYSALNGYNAVLKDDISLNFYLDLTTDVQKKGKVQIVLPDGTVEEQNISECKDSTYGYKFTAHVAAKEMASPVTVQVIGADGTVGSEYTYSVKEYAENTLKTSTDESEKALIKAMLNYGGYAQAYFGYAAENPANGSLAENEKALGEVSVSSNAAKVTDNDANVDFAGANLSLKNKTCLKVYFTLAEGTDEKGITFKVDGTPVEVAEVDGKYCVQIADILPNALSRSYTITAGDVTVVYSPYSYINEALSASEVPSNRLTELQNVVKALYFYGEAAKAYAAS